MCHTHNDCRAGGGALRGMRFVHAGGIVLQLSRGFTAMALACLGVVPSRANAATNITTYQLSANAIGWSTCGVTNAAAGCFGSGELDGFGNVCAIMESASSTKDEKTRRDLYVLDSDYDQKGSVALFVLRMVVTEFNASIATRFTKLKMLPLPLTGGASAGCVAAGTPPHRLSFWARKPAQIRWRSA